MQQQGHQVHIITARFPGEVEAETFVENYDFDGLKVTSFDKNKLPNKRVKDTYYQDEMRGPLREKLKELQPDIIHVVHLINHTSVLLEVINELKIPVIATFTDFYGFCFNNKLQAADESLCKGPSVSRTNCIACYLKATSDQQKNKLLNTATAKTPLVNVTANIANLFMRVAPSFVPAQYRTAISDLKTRPKTMQSCYEYFDAAIAPSKFLKKAYLNNHFEQPLYLQNFGVDIDRSEKKVREHQPLRIGFIGQIAAHKGVDILISAFENINNAELHIYGPEDQDKSYVSALKKAANVCKEKVVFHGTFYPEKMAEIMQELDFLVIPSRWYENSPLVLLYALATHTPVIVSDVEGMTEFVIHGVNGYVFPMGSSDRLSEIISKITQNPENAKLMSKNTHYSRTTKDMADDVLTLYESLI